MPVSAETLATIMKHVKDPGAVLEIVSALDADMSRVTVLRDERDNERDIKRREQARRRKQAQRERDKVRDISVTVTQTTKAASISKKVRTLEEGKEGKVITTAEADLFEGAAVNGASSWPSKKPKKIGTRIPEDFFPEPTDCDIGFERGMTEKDIEGEHHKFMDFWRAKAGKDATKLDWNAAFRYWLRNANDYRRRTENQKVSR